VILATLRRVNLSDLQVDDVFSYLLAFTLPALDAIVPAVPSETAIVALGVATAGSVDPRIGLLIALAATGAFLGDNVCYLLGARFGPQVDRRFFSGERGSRRRAWAEQTLDRNGAGLIVLCRFIPGARTAVTLTCGVTHFRLRTFRLATAAAGTIWAVYAFLIGRIGGKAFEGKPLLSLGLAFGIALLVSALVEGGRRVVGWRRSRRRRDD
jgi:membrane-associated protein